jgi:hypothetical protein
MRFLLFFLCLSLCVPVLLCPVLAETVDPSATPAQDAEYTTVQEGSYEEQVLTVLGNIQGYLIFFALVIMLVAVYKFFRIFF